VWFVSSEHFLKETDVEFGDVLYEAEVRWSGLEKITY
jgi:hypothetical protein